MKPFNALIADDHQLFREGMESLLRKLPFINHVFHAGDGREAITSIEQNGVDLVFMDIRMPGLSGIEATRMLREKACKVNIIAITMMEDPHSVVSMFRAGANGYLLKNTSFDELQQAIEAVMSGERYYSNYISKMLLDSLFGNISATPVKTETVVLSAREKEIIGLICQGFASKDIADMLSITLKTVENHRTKIYAKLHISNSADLVHYALQEGILKGR